MAVENYYALLNLPVTADAAQLARALKRQSEAGKLSLEQVRAIQKILLDAQRRQVYDRLLQQAQPQIWPNEAVVQTVDNPVPESVSASPWKPSALWVLGVLLPLLLLGAWLGIGYFYNRNMQDADLSPAFVQGLQTWIWRDLRLDYDALNGLAINDNLDVLHNGKQATQHPYIAAMNDIRTEYRNQGQHPPRPIAWLHNQSLLVGGDVWALGSSGARKRFSVPSSEITKTNAYVRVLPQRRTVMWVNRQAQGHQLVFLDSDSGRQITFTLRVQDPFHQGFVVDETPAEVIHFSADERYMLISYIKQDHLWALEHAPDGQVQGLRYIGAINHDRAHSQRLDKRTLTAWLASQSLVTVHDNGEIRHWSLPQLKLLKTENLGQKVLWAQFGADGKHIWLELDAPMNFQFAHYTLADARLGTMETHIATSGRYVLGSRHLWLYSWQDKWSHFFAANQP